MARPKGTSRITDPGTASGGSGPVPRHELPSIRKRRPALFWTVVVASLAMLLPVVAGLVQALA
jgi:hypothetical protein